MEVDKSEWKILQQAITEWEQAEKLTKAQADDLSGHPLIINKGSASK